MANARADLSIVVELLSKVGDSEGQLKGQINQIVAVLDQLQKRTEKMDLGLDNLAGEELTKAGENFQKYTQLAQSNLTKINKLVEQHAVKLTTLGSSGRSPAQSQLLKTLIELQQQVPTIARAYETTSKEVERILTESKIRQVNISKEGDQQIIASTQDVAVQTTNIERQANREKLLAEREVVNQKIKINQDYLKAAKAKETEGRNFLSSSAGQQITTLKSLGRANKEQLALHEAAVKKMNDGARAAKAFAASLDTLGKRKLEIEALLKASPAVPFTQGIENMRKKLLGLPKEAQFVIKVEGLEGQLGKAEAASQKLIAAQQRLQQAQLARASAVDDVAARQADKEIKRAQSQVNYWTKSYQKQQAAATELYNALDKEITEYVTIGVEAERKIQEARRQARAASEQNAVTGISADERARVDAAIAAGNQILANAKQVVDQRLEIENRAYSELIRAEEALAQAKIKFMGAEDPAIRAEAEAELQSAARVLQIKKRAYSDAIVAREEATSKYKQAVDRELQITAEASSKEVNLRKNAQREEGKIYAERAKEKEAAAQREREIDEAYRQNNLATEKATNSARAADWRRVEEDRRATSKRVQGEIAQGFRAMEEDRRKNAKLTAEQIQKYAQQQKDDIADTLREAQAASKLARQAIDEALVSGRGSRGRTAETNEAYNEIRRQVKLIEDANRRATRAVRDGSREDANAAADATAKARARIEAELKKIGKTWNDVKNSGLDAAKSWESRMTTLSYQFSHAGFQMGIIGATLLRAFTEPISSAKELAKTIEYTNAILGASVEQSERLRKAALEMGSTSIYSSQQIAEGMRAMAQAGFTATEAISGVKPILDFASAGMLDLDAAARIAVSTMHQFGLSIGDLPSITNTIAKAANSTNAEVKDFGESLKNVGPTAAAVGASLEDTTVALGLLSQAGLNAGIAGTQMRGFFRKLLEGARETGKTRKVLDELGLSVVDAAGNFKDLEVFLQEFINATAGLSEVQRTAKIFEIFGQRAGGPAFVSIINQMVNAAERGEDAFGALRTQIFGMADSAKVAEDRGEGLWGALEKLNNAGTALVQTIGFTQGSVLKPFIELLIGVANALQTAVENSAIVKFFVSLGVAAAGVVGILLTLGGAAAILTSNFLANVAIVKLVKTFFTSLKLEIIATTAVMEANAGATVTLSGVQKAWAVVLAITTRSVNALKVALATLLGPIGLVIAAGTALIGVFGYMAWKENKDQVDALTASIEKYREAASKPLPTKKQFSLMSVEARREAVKNLADTERFYTATINKLEREIESKKFWTLGLGDTTELETQLEEAKKQLNEAFKAEQFIKIQKIDVAAATTDAKQKVVQLVTDLDLLLGNTKLGLDKIDVSKGLKQIDKTIGRVLEIKRVSADAKKVLENAFDIDFSSPIEGADRLKDALRRMGVDVNQSLANELQGYRILSEKKIQFIEDYYAAAMDATEDWADQDKEEQERYVKARQDAYDQAIKGLEGLLEESLQKEEKYQQDVKDLAIEAAKARVDATNWLIEQQNSSEKLQSDERRIREKNEAIERLNNVLQTQLAAGDLAAAKKTFEAMKKLTEEADKIADERIADAFEKEKKLGEQIDELHAKMADREEARQTKLADLKEAQAEKDRELAKRIADERDKLSDLKGAVRQADEDKERTRALKAVTAQEKVINELIEKRKKAQQEYTKDVEKAGRDSTTDKGQDRKLAQLEKELTQTRLITTSRSEEVEQARKLFEEKQKELDSGGSQLRIEEQLLINRQNQARIAEYMVLLADQSVENAQARLKIQQETTRKLEASKAIIKALNVDQGEIFTVDKLSENLKKIKADLEGTGIEAKISVSPTGDKTTVALFDAITGKKIEEVTVPMKAGGDVSKLTQVIDGMQTLRTQGATQATLNTNVQSNDPTGFAIMTGQKVPVPVQTTLEVKTDSGDEKKAEDAGSDAGKGYSQKFWQVIDEKNRIVWTNYRTDLKALTEEVSKAAGKPEVWDRLADAANQRSVDIGQSFGSQLLEGLKTAETGLESAVKTVNETAKAGAIEVVQAHGAATQQVATAWSVFGNAWQEDVVRYNSTLQRDTVAAHTQTIETITTGWEAFFNKMESWTDKLKRLFSSVDIPTPDINGPDAPPSPARWGGLVRGMARGGHLPGYGGGDRRLTMLEDGEYVLPKEAVRGIGVQTLNQLRALFTRGLGLPRFGVGVPRMATGGIVGPTAPESLGTYTLNLKMGKDQYPLMGRKEVVSSLLEAMRREGMTTR